MLKGIILNSNKKYKCVTRASLQFTVIQAVKQPMAGHSPSLPRFTVKYQHKVWKHLSHLYTGEQSQRNHMKKFNNAS